MPKRKSVQKHKSDEVQGEGSWVEITAVKVAEIKLIRKLSADPEYDDFDGGIQLLARHIKDWNWVNDGGEPLPTPKADPSVIDELTDEESKFLVNLLIGDSKN